MSWSEHVVALTGGIGSGKSTVADMLAEHGAFVVDADHVAREVVDRGTTGLDEVHRAFGDDVLASDGSLDRARLAAKVFEDDAGLALLESIVHPRVQARAGHLFERELAAGRGGDPRRLLIYQLPLLAEDTAPDAFAAVVVVDCDDQTRLDRLVARGLSAEDARKRMTAQASRAERLAIADYVLPNDDGIEQLRAEVDQLWSMLTEDLLNR